MIQAWYEKIRDEKDSVYFQLRNVESEKDIPGGNRFPGFHHAVEFAFGLKGCIRIVIGGKPYDLHEGEICFMNSLEPHRYYYECGSSCYVVVISSGFFTDANRLGAISFLPHNEKGANFETLRRFLDGACAVWEEKSYLCKSAFSDMLAYLMTKYYPTVPKKEPEKQAATLLRAVKYICEHCTEPLTAEGVAKRFGYSANYFSTAFNAFMGAGFPEFLNICRVIESARIRRECPEMPIYRVAEQCGFHSMNTFYRAQNRAAAESRNPEGRADASAGTDSGKIGENDMV